MFISETPIFAQRICQGSVVCVSCVPTSCVHIWFVSCPCFMSLSVKYELILVQPCLSNYLWFTCVFIVLSVQFDFVWSTCDFPVYPVSLSCLDVLIKYYYLSLRPRLRVPVPPSCVHRDRRPDQNRKRRPFTSFCFRFQKSFVLFQSVCLCLSRGKEVAARNPAIAHCKLAWEFGGIAASPLAASPHARRSREISAAGGGSPKPTGWLPSSQVALPQARHSREITPPDRRWLNARRIAADSKPAGSPLTHAHRIAADSCPPDRRWLKPTGSALTHARWPPLSIAPWIESTRHGQECRVSVLLCPQEHFNHHVGLVHGDSSGAGGSSCCGHGGHSSRLPPCRGGGSGCWGTLWGPLMSCHAQRKPQLPSQPRRASGSCGLSCPVCLALEGVPVVFCTVMLCLAPEGSWYPLTSPGKFWGGYKSSGCRGRAERTEAKAPEDHLPWPPELPAPPWPPELPAPPWPPELPAPPWPPELPAPPWPPYCLFRSGGPRPVFLSVSVLRGLQSAHPPSPMELLRLGTSLSGGGSYVRVLSCVCHVFPPLVSIYGLFPVLVSCHY